VDYDDGHVHMVSDDKKTIFFAFSMFSMIFSYYIIFLRFCSCLSSYWWLEICFRSKPLRSRVLIKFGDVNNNSPQKKLVDKRFIYCSAKARNTNYKWLKLVINGIIQSINGVISIRITGKGPQLSLAKCSFLVFSHRVARLNTPRVGGDITSRSVAPLDLWNT